MSQDKRRHITTEQLHELWDFLRDNRDIAVGYNKTTQARSHSRSMWMSVAEKLNSQGRGAVKEWSGWSKYWTDYKSKLKKRVASLNRTGGGPSTEPPLSSIEEMFLQILEEDLGSGFNSIQINPIPNYQEEQEDNKPNPFALEQLVDTVPFGTNIGACTSASTVKLEVETPIAESSLEVPAPMQISEVQSSSEVHVQPSQDGASTSDGRTVRRRHRLSRPMSQQKARRALVESAKVKADSAKAVLGQMENIHEGIKELNATLRGSLGQLNATMAAILEELKK